MIKVVGVGGAGVNAVNRMVDARIPGVEFMAVNTDLQSLQLCVADVTVHIGDEQTRGLGAGADAEVGHRSAFEEQDKIKRLLKGSDMVFVAAGAGGGTGTGAAPVVARLAREVGALTVGIVTKPFTFEGNRRAKQADKGIEELAAEVDTLIVVPNDRLLEVLDQQTSMVEAFQVADDVLRQGVQGISDLVTLPAVINLDFADVRTIMSDAGRALLGIGMAHGEDRAILAAEKAISSPLLETSMDGARSILLSITGGADLSLVEVSEAAKVVGEAAHPDANIIFGANVDEELSDQIWVTVVATRFDGRAAPPRRGRRADDPPHQRPESRRGRGGGRAASSASTFPSSPRLSQPARMTRGRRSRPSGDRRGRAAMLRAGGNAVDAAVAAVLASFAVESPLTGFGAGGYMIVHRDGGGTTLIDFFVAAPGLDGIERRAELVPVAVRFDAETMQTFTSGRPPAGCRGPPPGWRTRCGASARCRSRELVGPAMRLAREGAPVNREQAYILEILAPIHERCRARASSTRREGGALR